MSGAWRLVIAWHAGRHSAVDEQDTRSFDCQDPRLIGQTKFTTVEGTRLVQSVRRWGNRSIRSPEHVQDVPFQRPPIFRVRRRDLNSVHRPGSVDEFALEDNEIQRSLNCLCCGRCPELKRGSTTRVRPTL